MKILFCQLRTHGDIIRTFPVIDLIRQKYPAAFLAATGYDFMASTWKLNPSIDCFLSQPVLKSGGKSRFNPLLDCSPLEGAVNIARDTGYNIYIDFQGSLQSALFGDICRIPCRLGPGVPVAKDGAHLFYTCAARFGSAPMNRMQRHLLLAQTLFPELRPVCKQGPVCGEHILIVPGSSKIGSLKRWPFEYYFQLSVKLLSLTRKKIIIALGPEDPHLGPLAAYLPKDIICVTVNSFEDYLNCLFQGCVCVIGNDSAPLHLAIWRGIPVFMLFGPTSPLINGPWPYAQGTYIKGRDCPACPLWSGKCSNGHSCMRIIDVSYACDKIYKYIQTFACETN